MLIMAIHSRILPDKGYGQVVNVDGNDEDRYYNHCNRRQNRYRVDEYYGYDNYRKRINYHGYHLETDGNRQGLSKK